MLRLEEGKGQRNERDQQQTAEPPDKKKASLTPRSCVAERSVLVASHPTCDTRKKMAHRAIAFDVTRLRLVALERMLCAVGLVLALLGLVLAAPHGPSPDAMSIFDALKKLVEEREEDARTVGRELMDANAAKPVGEFSNEDAIRVVGLDADHPYLGQYRDLSVLSKEDIAREEAEFVKGVDADRVAIAVPCTGACRELLVDFLLQRDCYAMVHWYSNNDELRVPVQDSDLADQLASANPTGFEAAGHFARGLTGTMAIHRAIPMVDMLFASYHPVTYFPIIERRIESYIDQAADLAVAIVRVDESVVAVSPAALILRSTDRGLAFVDDLVTFTRQFCKEGETECPASALTAAVVSRVPGERAKMTACTTGTCVFQRFTDLLAIDTVFPDVQLRTDLNCDGGGCLSHTPALEDLMSVLRDRIPPWLRFGCVPFSWVEDYRASYDELQQFMGLAGGEMVRFGASG